ncbi:collagen alpha-1(IV) chain-like [Rousettus aegyptiacus]|uniref:collagen alpha-1(IV) chain-like n=1 Tax=Rousettus aegyptiacus TaxID=9407 RepID=UPI00168D1AAE|nr:collagen alpha-1(IV) chain-like [Rousettus aegyptiacus]
MRPKVSPGRPGSGTSSHTWDEGGGGRGGCSDSPASVGGGRGTCGGTETGGLFASLSPGPPWECTAPLSAGAPGLEGPSGEAPTYVNIPASPSSRKQLHYLGLELGESGAGVQGAGTSRYAQIDLVATAAAHRAGAQHARARAERLAALEPKKKDPR